mmetsp:Transcript_22526/g.32443  ORF Transcript_22526/g.32443 Transcript_22526/m.32443 type:complete len:181 (-) Transcript_22526:127-669(-)
MAGFVPPAATGVGLRKVRTLRRCAENGLCDRIRPIAESFASPLGLKVEQTLFENRKLSVFLGDGERKPTLEDCESLSKILDDTIADDESYDSLTGSNFSLIVSTAGIRDVLTQDFEFNVFKGFSIIITTSEEFKGKRELTGSLHGRDEKHVRLNKKGRIIKIPRRIVTSVELTEAKSEGD